MAKVTIIGAGSVGSTIAFAMASGGYVSEIVMIDINEEKALGEALDIRQGVPFCPPVSIYAGSYRDAANSDIVVLTSGLARKPGQTRLDLAQANVNIMKSIIPQVTAYAPDATYVIVSNPVDIITSVWNKLPGFRTRRSSVPAPFLTQHVSAQESPNITTLTSRTCTLMYSANTATLPLYRGLLRIFPMYRLRNTPRS